MPGRARTVRAHVQGPQSVGQFTQFSECPHLPLPHPPVHGPQSASQVRQFSPPVTSQEPLPQAALHDPQPNASTSSTQIESQS